MKIRCIKLLNHLDKSPNPDTRNAWLTVGKEYMVLGIYGDGATLKYRLIADDNHTPGLQDADQFEITAPEIPSGWMFHIYQAGQWVMQPSAWVKTGFWEAYFDQDEAAELIFDTEVLRLKEHHGLPVHDRMPDLSKIRKVLLQGWEPFGAGVADEYNSYVHRIGLFLKENCSLHDLQNLLQTIEEESGTTTSDVHRHKTAIALKRLK